MRVIFPRAIAMAARLEKKSGLASRRACCKRTVCLATIPLLFQTQTSSRENARRHRSLFELSMAKK